MKDNIKKKKESIEPQVAKIRKTIEAMRRAVLLMRECCAAIANNPPDCLFPFLCKILNQSNPLFPFHEVNQKNLSFFFQKL